MKKNLWRRTPRLFQPLVPVSHYLAVRMVLVTLNIVDINKGIVTDVCFILEKQTLILQPRNI